MTDSAVQYDREALVQVLIYHWRTDTSGCGCGWGVLGHSHAEHVADIYEEVLKEQGGMRPYKFRCRAGHFALHDDGRCHAAVFGEECGLELVPVRAGKGAVTE